jgi:HEPN domain-containing protein
MSENRNRTESERWLRQALHDRDAARLNRDNAFHEHACFLAQQSAEKALKAFLYARGEGPVLGHSTLSLTIECGQIEKGFDDLRDSCRRLDQLYIPTRYPNGLPDNIPHEFYDQGMADQALSDLDRVIDCVRRFVATEGAA